MLCRPFIVPGTVRQAKVTILAPDTITVNEAYRMFLSALESMGLTVQPEGKVLKIIESNRARESAIPIYGEDNEPPSQDQYVTRMLRLDHVTPDELKPVLDKLKGKDGDITPYAPTNTLVITDLATNIARIEQVVRQLDVPLGGERIFIIKLHTVQATEMAHDAAEACSASPSRARLRRARASACRNSRIVAKRRPTRRLGGDVGRGATVDFADHPR